MRYLPILTAGVVVLTISVAHAGDHCVPYYYPAPASPPRYFPEYAPAFPAPPSETPAVPAQRPQVIESRSAYLANQALRLHEGGPVRYDAYKVAGNGGAKSNNGQVSISFWNLSARPLSLRTNGKSYTLDKDQQLTLNLPRRFLWQIGGQDPVTTTLPDEQRALEIVFRTPNAVADRGR